MTLAPAELSAALQPVVDRALSRLAQVLPEPAPAELQPLLTRLAVASDFALDTLERPALPGRYNQPMTLAPAELSAALQPVVDRALS
ncbi:hypothetical protein C7E17_09885, partial [Stenotrophomonas maltophilia]